jgi:hypothetical protein
MLKYLFSELLLFYILLKYSVVTVIFYHIATSYMLYRVCQIHHMYVHIMNVHVYRP